MPMGCSRTQNRTFGRRSKVDRGTRQRSAYLRRMSSAEAALSQALFSVPSSALIRTSSFGDSDVVARLRSNSSRRDSMAALPKMETDDADKEGEGATRERSTSMAMTDGAAWVVKKDTLSSEPPLVMQQVQQADERGMGRVKHEDVRLRVEPLAPSPLPQQEDTHEGEDRGEEGVVEPGERDTIEQPRDAEGAGMADERDDVTMTGEPQEERRAEVVAEREEAQLAEVVGSHGEGVVGERESAAVEVAPQLQAQVHVDAELEVDVNMPLAPQQQQQPLRVVVMTAEPEEGDVESGVKERADMALAPLSQEQDLDAEVAVLMEAVEEGGSGGKGDPVVVHQRETALMTPMPQQQEGVNAGTGTSVEVKERRGHLVAELEKEGLPSALVVYKHHRRTTCRPRRRALKHAPTVTLCLRVLRDATATIGGPSLRRGALWMMGGDTSAFTPYIRRRPLTTSHGSTAITASPITTKTTTTTTTLRTTTIISASSSSSSRSSSAHVFINTTTVFSITPSTTRACHQRSKTRAAVSAATGAGDLLERWRPYALPALTNNPAITTTTTTPSPPSVIDRHTGRCAWMEGDSGGDCGFERLLRERRPGLLQGMQSSLRRMRDRMTSAAVTTASSSRNTHTHESGSTGGGGGGGGGGDEAAEGVAAVGCWSFSRGRRRSSSNRKA